MTTKRFLIAFSWLLAACSGDPGSQGLTGLPGHDGRDGRDGTNGSTGPIGAKGDQGTQGDPGAAGPQGPSNGIVGPKGDTGAAGPQGIQGPAGPSLSKDRLVSRVSAGVDLPTQNGEASTAAMCVNTSDVLLTGGCSATNGVQIQASYPTDAANPSGVAAWQCKGRNEWAQTGSLVAYVVCYAP